MAVRLYNEYIKVDPNFIPVFSRNSDRTYPDKWQSFYPHTSFKNILKDIIETLEKSNETKDRSIWMSGAYGTGKTYLVDNQLFLHFSKANVTASSEISALSNQNLNIPAEQSF